MSELGNKSNYLKQDKTWNVVAVAIIIFGLISPIYTYWTFYSSGNYRGPWPLEIDQIAKLGPISDWIGGLSVPYFTLASVILLFLTYRAQREELQLTRDELAASRVQLAEQNRILAQQKFEESFFYLLTMFREQYEKSFDYIRSAGRGLHEYIQYYETNLIAEMPFEKFAEGYFAKRHLFVGLDVYAKLLRQLVLFVASTEHADDETKKKYFALLETSMDSDELYLLFWECFFKGDRDSVTAAVKKYQLFDDVLNHRKTLISGRFRDTFLYRRE